jgi:hypothetical protein
MAARGEGDPRTAGQGRAYPVAGALSPVPSATAVISTSVDGVASVIAHHQPLTGSRAYDSMLGSPPDQVTSLLFSDLPQLLNLGEQTGLIQSTRLATVWPDLAKIRAIGLTSTRGELDTTTELSLQIR